MNNNGMKKRWISLYVENQVGVLSKISGLFSGKSYNLDSLTVGTTEDPTVSRMTIATVSDDETFEQLPQEIKSVISLSKSRIYGDEIQQSEKTAAEEKKKVAIESVQPEPVKKIVTEQEKKRFIEFRESSIADFVDTFDLDHPFELGICVEESAGQYTTVSTAEGFGQMSFF